MDLLAITCEKDSWGLGIHDLREQLKGGHTQILNFVHNDWRSWGDWRGSIHLILREDNDIQPVQAAGVSKSSSHTTRIGIKRHGDERVEATERPIRSNCM